MSTNLRTCTAPRTNWSKRFRRWRPKILAGPPAPGDGTNDWLAVPAGLLESAREDAVRLDNATTIHKLLHGWDDITIYGYPSCIAFHKRCNVWVLTARLAYTTSLRLSLTLLPTPLFQAFLSLKAHGGTLLRRRQSWSRSSC